MNSLRKAAFLLAVVSLLLLFAWLPGTTSAQESQGDDSQNSLVYELQELTGGKVRISTHAQTGMVRFIGTELSNSIPQPATLKAGASPEDAARGFLSKYGELFGLANQSSELNVMRSKTVDGRRSFVRFQQVYEGIPIVGGELIVQVGPTENNIISANGEILPDISLDTTPTVAASSAQEAALNVVVKGYGIDPGALRVSEPELWIYNSIILGMNFDVTSLVWRMEVESVELLPVRELVLVDAHLGAIALHFNQIETTKYREVYTAHDGTDCTDTMPGWLLRSEGDPATGNTDADYAYDYTGDTYDFYYDEHSRDSIDNAGMTIISTVDYDPDGGCDWLNAQWTGSQMRFGTGFPSADDIVAHEFTHGVTDYESNLFYYMQSGAINEAFSDIWGEFVDLGNSAGTDTPAVRWLCGEDSPFGAIRDMSNPPAYNSGLGLMPDRMTSSYYYCGSLDGGGVHHNMGVGSKAAYLMVDGDTFNSITVTGMGIPKTADVWYEVQTNLFTSASDYADLYDGLQQAAINLGYDANDRQTVKDAIDATEMNQQPTSCPATHAPVCDTGTPNNLWFDDLEAGAGNWGTGFYSGSSEWYYASDYATSGLYHLWGWDAPGFGTYGGDYYVVMNVDVALPAGSTPYLHFNHAYAFEDFETTMYDGGVLEYSTDGGDNWNDAGSLFTHNGYNGTIEIGYLNPLEGRQAFVGESNGYISSRLDLSSLADQSVRFRFRIGTDYWEETSARGWFIDDIRIYTCEAAAPPDLEITEKYEEWVVEGESYTITYTVTNNGDGNAGASTVSVDIDGSETLVAVPALDPGENWPDTRGPFTMSGNSDTILVCADTYNDVAESDEDNNCLENEWKFELEFGDAPDPTYPSLLASDGSRHFPTDTEILGWAITSQDSKDYEPDAKVTNLDLFDDGLLTFAIIEGNPAETVTFEITDFAAPSTDLRVNILIDLNADGDCSDAGEHVVVNQPITTTTAGVEEQIVISTPFSTKGATPGATWLRLTLTRSDIQNLPWDGTMTGHAQTIPFEYGETEDYVIGIEPMPDLEITEKSEEWVVEGETYNITYTVTNVGTATAGASTVSVDIDGSETLVAVPALDPGENWPDTRYSLTLVGDTDTILICADTYNDVAESDEDNNCLQNVWGLYVITGTTGEVNCDPLPSTTIEAYMGVVLKASTVSDPTTGDYTLSLPELGDYDIVASKTGYRNETQQITISGAGEYPLDFRGNYGLIPNAPSMSYVLDCVHYWLYPDPPCELSMSKVLDVVHAWLYPISP